ncbi:MAG: multiheme c-type cytochrome [SAR324 cluster bacterium]|nr:multiheme c-type cytochrome [SAR324 cluster bacterium]
MKLSLPLKFISLVGLATLLYWAFLPQKSGFLVTGDYRGEIKPCGCSQKGDQGGIERASSFIKSHKTGKFWVDLGNFSAQPTEQGHLKTALFVTYFKKLGLTALLPGPREFASGESFFTKHPLPYLLSNQKRELVPAAKKITSHGVDFYGFLSPDLLSKGTHITPWLNDVDLFLERLGEVQENSVLLFRGNDQELLQLNESGKFKLIIVGNQGLDEVQQTLKTEIEAKTFYKPPVKGQGILQLKRLEDQTGKIIWLTAEVKSDKSWLPHFKEYNARVNDLFMAFLEQQSKAPEKRVYKGKAHCISCHPSQGELYEQSRHATAYESLKAVNKEFDPECITCHVAGFKKGGFLSAEITPHLKGVSCENCHGPFVDHKNGWKDRKKVEEATCKGCHTVGHSPDFNFETYFKKIVHSK